MTKQSLVSIITPSYNSSDYIKDTIYSVIAQTHKNWELLITDDGSTDDTIQLIETLIKKDNRIKLIKIKNSGPAVARNKSIDIAKGKYMAFLDSDDLWFPNFIEESIKQCKDSEGFVCSSYELRNNKMEKIYKDLIVPLKVSKQDILKRNTISCLTAFVDVEKLGKLKMPLVRYRQDMGLWIQYLEKVKFNIGIQKPLAIYRIREDSHSRNKKKLLFHQWFFYRNVANLSIIISFYYMIVWGINGVLKYRK